MALRHIHIYCEHAFCWVCPPQTISPQSYQVISGIRRFYFLVSRRKFSAGSIAIGGNVFFVPRMTAAWVGTHLSVPSKGWTADPSLPPRLLPMSPDGVGGFGGRAAGTGPFTASLPPLLCWRGMAWPPAEECTCLRRLASLCQADWRA